MGKPHKKRGSCFKLVINDWDIPFPKIVRIYQWVGKNIFPCGKWSELSETLPIPQNGENVLKIYISSLCI